MGLLLFGELCARVDQRALLVGSLLVYGLVSALCCFSPSIRELILLRFVQGAAGSAGAVIAPGILRALYGDLRAVSALGLLGSVESLTPALAPIAGLWLLEIFGWKASFNVIAVLAFALAAVMWLARAHLPTAGAGRQMGSYGQLLGRWRFLRPALSQAFALGALLVFVFGAPTVITKTLGGTLHDFIVLQVSGIASFILAANSTGALSRRFGTTTMIMSGALLSALGATAMLAYAIVGEGNVTTVTCIFLLFNFGFGLRGPTGFHAALVASDGDDTRGAAIVTVAILLITAVGTAAVAPFITYGLVSIAAPAAVLSIAAALTLAVMPLR